MKLSSVRHACAALAAAMGLVALAGAAAAAAASGPDFSWNESLSAGKTIAIYGINGHVTATRATGRQASVTAVKHGNSSQFDLVKIEATPSANGITVCALYPTKHGGVTKCEADRGISGDGDLKDVHVEVDFTIQVPEGVKLDANDVNGGIDALDLAGDIEAKTVNGAIHATTTGLVEATTVNGSINAAMGKGTWDRLLRFEAVNGSIKLRLPHEVNADLSAQSVNGTLESDFPVYVEGKMLGRSSKIGGKLGKGGGELHIETVNGSITLTREGGPEASSKGTKM
jgi:hypothetical protein